MSPERVSQGAAGRYQALIFLVYPLALSPIALAYLTRYAFDSQAAFSVALAAAACLGGMVYGTSVGSAVRTAIRNKGTLCS